MPWQKLRPWYGLSLIDDEALEPVDRTQDGVDAPPALALRDAGILRVAAHPDFVLFGDRHHTFQEVGDPLPVGVGVDLAGDRQRRILLAASA